MKQRENEHFDATVKKCDYLTKCLYDYFELFLGEYHVKQNKTAKMVSASTNQ